MDKVTLEKCLTETLTELDTIDSSLVGIAEDICSLIADIELIQRELEEEGK